MVGLASSSRGGSDVAGTSGGREEADLDLKTNVDPIDVARNVAGLNPETTLVVVVSKTFTTAETMLNARTLRESISSALGFLKGASSIDEHFRSAPFEKNIPVLLGLLSVWNVSFLGYPARAI